MQPETPISHTLTAPDRLSGMNPVQNAPRLRHLVPLTVALMALWIILSGRFDLFHLSFGMLSALAITLGTNRLLLLPPAIGPATLNPFTAHPWLRLLTYVPWLFWQIVLSSLHIAYVVLHPQMPITPRVVSFQVKLPHALARLTLANSITLTPGTVTIDVRGDEFLVHALTATSIQGLLPAAGEGDMQQRVTKLFSDDDQSSSSGEVA
jgi:multicomponent Na+:H+ antiporter subunit E